MRLSGGEKIDSAALMRIPPQGGIRFFWEGKMRDLPPAGQKCYNSARGDRDFSEALEDAVKRIKGLLVFFAQWIVLFGLYFLLHQLYWLSGPWHGIASWGLMPLIGMVSAYMATVRGVNNYLAWPAPPVCMFVAYWLALGYTPEGTGPTFLCALLAIFGAAAGEVVKRGPKRDSQQDSHRQAPRGRE